MSVYAHCSGRRREDINYCSDSGSSKRNPSESYGDWGKEFDGLTESVEMIGNDKPRKDLERSLILSPEDFTSIEVIDEDKKESFLEMKSVCPQCGILVNYGGTGSHHHGFPEDHILISIEDAAEYVLDNDFKFYMKHLKSFKEFVGQQVTILEQKRDALRSALEVHKDIRTNVWRYYKNDKRLVNTLAAKVRNIVTNGQFRTGDAILSVEKMYSDVGASPNIPEPRLPFTKTLIKNLGYFLEYIKNEREKTKTVSQIFKQRLTRLFDCFDFLEFEFLEITGMTPHEYELRYDSIESQGQTYGMGKIVQKVESNLKNIERAISNFKLQIKYTKESKKLDCKNSTNLKILKTFAFTLLKYSSQLRGIGVKPKPIDSGDNYQMFYGSRYLENVEMAMIFGQYNRQSDGKVGKSDHIPISISKAFDSKISIVPHDSGTISGSADGYISVFDNHRSKQLYIANVLTGDAVIVLNNTCWVRPIFWEKKLLLFTTWDDSMLMFDRDEFMNKPRLSLGKKIPKERLLNLPDSFETHYTGRLIFSNIGGMIKTFDVEKEAIIEEVQTDKSFSPVPVFGKEKLTRSTPDHEEYDEKSHEDCSFLYLSTPTGLFRQNSSGDYEEILKTDGTVSSMILSNKHPEDPSKALIFCWSRIYYGNKSGRRLCNIPIKPINMIMRLYSNVYYIMNSVTHKWECRRIFFDDETDIQDCA